jgi:hypothetical protein
MAKSKNGSVEATKSGSDGQKLGCRLSSDASAILGALEYTLRSGTGDVVVRALVALADSLPRKQVEAIEAMVRIHGASLARLRRSCGASVAESVPEQPGQGGAGVVDSSGVVPALMARTTSITAMFNRTHAPIDEALHEVGGGN